MKRIAALLVLLAIPLTACQQDTPPPSPAEEPSPTASGSTEAEDIAQIYAAVIRRLVTEDHTFGGGPAPFKHVYVIDGPIPEAGNPHTNTLGPSPEPFPRELKEEIEEQLRDLPPLEFVTDPDDVRIGSEGMEGVKGDGVIISLGPIEREKNEVHVPNALWCGGLCGQWLTYVLREQDGRWRITGTTGQSAIS